MKIILISEPPRRRGIDIYFFRIFKLCSSVSLCFVLLLTGCGKKLPPVAPESVAPEPVKNMRAIIRDGKPVIAFSKPTKNADGSKLTDLAGFKIMRRTVEDKNGCKTCPEKFDLVGNIDMTYPAGTVVEGEQVIYSDSTAEAETRYEYKIVTYNRDGYDGPESAKIALFTDKAPDKPVEFSGTAGDKVIDLIWSEPQNKILSAEIILGYNVYRRVDGRAYPVNPVNSTPVKETKFSDFGLMNGTVYYYTVRAVAEASGSLIEGAASEEISLTPREAIFDELKGE